MLAHRGGRAHRNAQRVTESGQSHADSVGRSLALLRGWLARAGDIGREARRRPSRGVLAQDDQRRRPLPGTSRRHVSRERAAGLVLKPKNRHPGDEADPRRTVAHPKRIADRPRTRTSAYRRKRSRELRPSARGRRGCRRGGGQHRSDPPHEHPGHSALRVHERRMNAARCARKPSELVLKPVPGFLLHIQESEGEAS